MQLGVYETMATASVVLVVGRQLLRLEFLRSYSIPEPVAGGMLVAILIWAWRLATGSEIQFSTNLQTPFMLAFFATLGMSADVGALYRGGRHVLRFLLVVIGILLVQNVVGAGAAALLGLPAAIGLLAGSITLVGGHGTAAAWSPVLAAKFGQYPIAEMALASATFGLVLGAMLGGPVARILLRRQPSQIATSEEEPPHNLEVPGETRPITPLAFVEVLALLLLCIIAGRYVGTLTADSAIALPDFVWVLLSAVLLKHALLPFRYRVPDQAVSILGHVSLGLFVSMALMSLRLWEMASLALPLLFILMLQTAMAALYAVFVCYPIMVRSYDAIVLSAGFCGVALGATPTAVANMQAVTDRFGPSHLAFLVVPVVGAFFIDIVNAFVIRIGITLLT